MLDFGNKGALCFCAGKFTACNMPDIEKQFYTEEDSPALLFSVWMGQRNA